MNLLTISVITNTKLNSLGFGVNGHCPPKHKTQEGLNTKRNSL